MPLTERGVAQAHALASSLSDERIDAVFASPLGRALATATIIGTHLDLPVETIMDLSEVDHGGMAGMTTDEIDTHYPDALAERNADKYRFPIGESYADAARHAAPSPPSG